MLLLAASGLSWSTAAIIGSIATGLTVALIALVKLPTEKNSAAVAQAQGANETLVESNRVLRLDLDRANALIESANARADRCRVELDELRKRWGPFPPGDQPESST